MQWWHLLWAQSIKATPCQSPVHLWLLQSSALASMGHSLYQGVPALAVPVYKTQPHVYLQAVQGEADSRKIVPQSFHWLSTPWAVEWLKDSFLTPIIGRRVQCSHLGWESKDPDVDTSSQPLSHLFYPQPPYLFPSLHIRSEAEMLSFPLLEGQRFSLAVFTGILDTNLCSGQENHVQSRSLNICMVNAFFSTLSPS